MVLGIWFIKAIFAPTKRMCECDLTNSLGPNLTQDISSLSHVPEEHTPCAMWNSRHANLTDTMACENGLDGQHASRSMSKAFVGTHSVPTLTRALTPRTELVCTKSENDKTSEVQDQRKSFKICVMAKGQGAQRGTCLNDGVGAHTWAGVGHCESRTLVHAAYSFFWKRWVDSKCSTVHKHDCTLLPGCVLCGRCWSFSAEVWDRREIRCWKHVFSVVMAQREQWFSWFCFARLLHLRLDRD